MKRWFPTEQVCDENWQQNNLMENNKSVDMTVETYNEIGNEKKDWITKALWSFCGDKEKIKNI